MSRQHCIDFSNRRSTTSRRSLSRRYSACECSCFSSRPRTYVSSVPSSIAPDQARPYVPRRSLVLRASCHFSLTGAKSSFRERNSASSSTAAASSPSSNTPRESASYPTVGGAASRSTRSIASIPVASVIAGVISSRRSNRRRCPIPSSNATATSRSLRREASPRAREPNRTASDSGNDRSDAWIASMSRSSGPGRESRT